jgi:drug/metabolite transporter (DMT)-like permease
MPLILYYIIVLTGPLVVAALVSCLKHEKLTLVKIICLLAGFCGVMIAIAPRGFGGGAGHNEWIGYLAAMAATFCFAAYSVTTRKISATDSALSIQFCNSMTVGIAGLIGCFGKSVPVMGALAVLCGAGLLNIISNLIYNKALASTTATNVAQLHYTQIVTGAIVGFLVWHEQPTASVVAGSLLIVGSGLWVAARAQKDSAAAVQPLA